MAVLAGRSTDFAVPVESGSFPQNSGRYFSSGYVASASGTSDLCFLRPGPVADWGASDGAKVLCFDQSFTLLGTATFLPADGTGWISKAWDTPFAVTSGQTYYFEVISTGGSLPLINSGTGFQTLIPAGTYTYASPNTTIDPGTDAAGTHSEFNVYADGTIGGAAAPSITDVDEDDTVTLEQANVEIDGADFDTAAVEIRQGGFVYTPSIDSQNTTAIVFDMEAIGDTGPIDAPHAGSATLAVVNGDAQEDTLAVTVSDETGTATYLIGTPNADAGLRLTASADAVAGDYVRISNVQGGVIGDVTVNDDLTWDADEGVTSFDVQYWDAADGTYGDRETQTTTDQTPTAYAFTDITGAVRSTQYTSNTITVAGLGTGVTVDVTATDCTYSKNGAGHTADAGTATNDDTFNVRLTSSASYNTAASGVLNIGTATDTYTVTTLENQAPAFIGPTINDFELEVDVAMTPRNYASRFSDLDSLTFTLIGTPPAGLELSSAGVLSGTPTGLETASSLEIRASDGTLTGDSNSFAIEIVEELEAEGGSVIALMRRRGRR